jgi:hypothetical protein
MRTPITLRSAGARAAALGLFTLIACSKAPTEPDLHVTTPKAGLLAGKWSGTVEGAGAQSPVTATITQIDDRVGIQFETTFFEYGSSFTGILKGEYLQGTLGVDGQGGIFGCQAVHGPASGTASTTRIHLDIPSIPGGRNLLNYIPCPGAPRSTIELSR